MRHLLGIALMISVPAFAADDPPKETGPNFNEPWRQDVPYPLPPDFNECVVVVWGPDIKTQTGENGRMYSPPLSQIERDDISNGMRLDWGVYSRCHDQPA